MSAVQVASLRSFPCLALTAMEEPAGLGVSHDFFREHVASELRWVRRGRKKLVAVSELQRWLDQNAARWLFPRLSECQTLGASGRRPS
jgi:hypothetical protein